MPLPAVNLALLLVFSSGSVVLSNECFIVNPSTEAVAIAGQCSCSSDADCSGCVDAVNRHYTTSSTRVPDLTINSVCMNSQ